MTRPRMMLQVISKALWVRPGKLFLSVAALAVGATLASAFLSLYFDLPGKMSAEFRALGPNLIVAPRGTAQTFPATAEAEVIGSKAIVPRLPWLYAIGKVGGRDVILAGTELAHIAGVHPSWDGLPKQPVGEGLIAGKKAVEVFDWHPGQTVRIAYGEKVISMPLAAVVSTGGSEDSQVLLPLESLESLTGQTGRLSLIELAVPGSATAVESVRGQLAARAANLPEVEIRALRPVLESEARVVMKVRWLMLGLAGIVLALVMLGVFTNVSGQILDRQKDIGIMKALGGSDAGIARFFLAEIAVQALLAAAVGFGAGFGLAQAASEQIFHSAVAPRWDVAAAVTGITLGTALVATILPSRWIRRMEPAVILRGE